ncbi:MAG TPA: hypothetical protein VK500_00175 [Nitrospiraceae bacterium]|nr:hypothetical protein [Nitrospiraceae bacterium]
MSLWDALTGRIYAWNSATMELGNEVMARVKAPASTALIGRFRKWYLHFFAGSRAQFLIALEDKRPFDKFYWGRIKAFNKETFRTLHAVFLCHHLHVVREGLGETVGEMIDEAAAILDVSQTRMRDLFKSYDGKSESTDIYLHTWRLICQALRANDTEHILSMEIWLRRILDAATYAHGESPLVMR